MPFFSRNTEPEPEPVPVEPIHEENHKRGSMGGLFGSRNRSPSPASTVRTATTSNSRMTGTSPHSEHTSGGGLLRKNTNASKASSQRGSMGGLFGSRNRSPSPASTVRTATTSNSHMTGTSYHTSPRSEHTSGGGLFRKNTNASKASSQRGSVLQRTFGHGNNPDMDPSIVSARERVMGAEQAERDADRALQEARARVQDAREHVKNLELEAKEEARRAKIKQYHAREVSKRGKQLGRHDL